MQKTTVRLITLIYCQVQKKLRVNRTTLSATIRQKTSAEDKRVVAQAVGLTLGAAALSIVFGGIILCDLRRLAQDLKLFWTNAKMWLLS